MPHQCTNCGHAFEDGSKQMLGGCPECGGNKFQFLPSGAADSDDPAPEPEADPSGGGGRPTESAVDSAPRVSGIGAGEPDDAEDPVGRPWPETARPPTEPPAPSSSATGSTDTDDDADIIEAPAEPVPATADIEDAAQASARRSVVTADELPPVAARDDDDRAAEPDEKEEERPSLAALRKELNEQFESIKILQPGEYELNLMELYDREEYIIALEEDGRYVIEVPDSWRSEQ